jgi:hypothetical protein
VQIELVPEQVERELCRCCFIVHPPMWYLGMNRTFSSGMRRFKHMVWIPICCADGSPIGQTKHYGPD